MSAKQQDSESGPEDDRFIKPHPVEITVEEIDVSTSIECGFRQEWISGTSPSGVELELSCGAGCGSPWAEVRVKPKDGEVKYFRIDGRELLNLVYRLAEGD